MRDEEFGRLMRVSAWVVLAILCGILGNWLLTTGLLHTAAFTFAVIFAVVSAFDMPFIFKYSEHAGLAVLGVIAMVLTVIPGLLVFGWWGFAFMLGCLVVYMLGATLKLKS